MRRLIVPALLLILSCCAPALAGNPIAGPWRGSSGTRIYIPEGAAGGGADFSLVMLGFKGEKMRFRASWVAPGSVFTWTDAVDSRHTATYDPKENRICDLNPRWPKSPAYWYRLTTPAAPIHLPMPAGKTPLKIERKCDLAGLSSRQFLEYRARRLDDHESLNVYPVDYLFQDFTSALDEALRCAAPSADEQAPPPGRGVDQQEPYHRGEPAGQ